MAKTIIVPLLPPDRDVDDVAPLALPVAQALAVRNDAKIILTSVIEVGAPIIRTPGAADEEMLRAREDYLQQVAQSMPDIPTEIVLHQGVNVAERIAEVVAENDEPVVVMASNAHRGLRRTVLGSVAFEVVQTAVCPVIIIPANVEPLIVERPQLKSVLLPVDQTPATDANLAALLFVLGEHPVDIHLLAEAPTVEDQMDSEFDGDAFSAHLGEMNARLTGAGHQVTVELAEGTPEDRITLAAQDIDVDLISMTTRGRTGVARIVLGSIAETVLRDSGLPVLLSRFNDDDAAEAESTLPPR